MVVSPFWELFGSLLLGAITASVLLAFATRLKELPDRLVVVLAMIFATAGIAELLHLSSLLACMAMGCAAVNILPRETDRLFSMIKSIDTPIYVIFFVLAGANLQLGMLAKVGAVGVAYMVSRALGKIAGASIGAKLSQAPSTVVKYLGLALLPQAGVAIGVTLVVQQSFPEISSLVTTVILGSVVVYEIVGPFFSKMAITKAGEVGRSENPLPSTPPAEQ